MRIRFREKTAFEAARCRESSGELHNPGQGWYHVYTFRAKPDEGRPVEEEAWLDESCRQEQLALVLILIGDYRASSWGTGKCTAPSSWTGTPCAI